MTKHFGFAFMARLPIIVIRFAIDLFLVFGRRWRRQDDKRLNGRHRYDWNNRRPSHLYRPHRNYLRGGNGRACNDDKCG